jgi:hypothetical protein
MLKIINGSNTIQLILMNLVRIGNLPKRVMGLPDVKNYGFSVILPFRLSDLNLIPIIGYYLIHLDYFKYLFPKLLLICFNFSKATSISSLILQ